MSRPLAAAPALLTAVVALLAFATTAAAGERRVPAGWLGVTVDGPVGAADDGEWDLMATSGVESVRAALRWHEFQPYRSAAEVPAADAARFRDAGGVPTDFTGFDAIVAAASQRGLAILPVVQSTAGWAARRLGDTTSPPRDHATFERFLTALVARYGPRGSLWAERPELPRIPIREWQIWNEPNITRYWSTQPFARPFVRLLRTAHRALHAADRGATVVLAGLPNVSWEALRSIYRAGGRGSFDAVALHPYTGTPSLVMRLVRSARRVMGEYGDRRLPIWVTELSWPAGRDKLPRPTGFNVTEAEQPRRLSTTLRLLSAARKRQRIERVFWYTWLSTEAGASAFDWAGLRRLREGAAVDAPALATFRHWARRLQGCAKTTDARRCA
jgi:hypothetical protein